MELAYIAADEAVALTVQQLSVRTDLGLLNNSSMLLNSSLQVLDTNGKPLGIRGVESTNTAARTAYLTPIEGGGMRISGSVDSSLAFGWPAVPIDDKIQYRIVIKHKSSASSASGLYLRVNESATALDPGTTHIGIPSTSESDVSARDSYVDLVTNGPMPGTSETTVSYIYTPTPGTWLASFAVYNWTGFSGDYDVISVQMIPTSDAIYGYADALVEAESLARTTGFEAAAVDRSLIRTEFETAVDDALTTATALVEAESTARSTALGAAATDRTAIRTEFAAADAGILTSATALVDAESTARTTALEAAATDRSAIRTEFAAADTGVLTSATALVDAEATARTTAVDAVSTNVTNLTASFKIASLQNIVSDFNADGFYWTTAFGGAPEAVADPVSATYTSVSNIGRVLQFSSLPKYLTPKAAITPYVGMKLRLEAKVRATANPSSGAISVGVAAAPNGLSSSWAHGIPSSSWSGVSGYSATKTGLVVADGWVTLAIYITCTGISTYDAGWRPRLDFTHTGSGGTVQVAYFNIEDVTVQENYTNAQVSSEAAARATAVGAVATDLSTLSISVGTLSGTVSTHGELIGDIQGNLTARYGISVDGGGNGAFVSLEDGTSEPSSVTLGADKITLDGDVFITGSVTGPEMFGNNAISITSAAYTAAVISYGSGGAGNAQSLSVTATGKPILLTFSALFIGSCDPGGSLTQSVTLKRGSTTIVGEAVINNASASPGFDLYQQYCIQIIDTPAAGTYTYYLYVGTTGSDISRNDVSHRSITALEVKR